MATVKPWNEKPRGPKKKNMAKTSFEELYGATTASLNSEEPKRISSGRRHNF